jgi:DNA replication protein DnaC
MNYLELLKKKQAEARWEPEPEKLAKARLQAKAWLEAAGYLKTPHTPKLADYIARYKLGRDANKTQPWEPAKNIRYPRKGLILLGSLGTGKTTVLSLMAGMFQVDMYSEQTLMIEFAKGNVQDVYDITCGEFNNAKADLIIDDFGSEKNAASYGNYLDLGSIIMARYELWRKNGARLFISTNNGWGQIRERDPRVEDRLREMCEPVVMAGESFRRQ